MRILVMAEDATDCDAARVLVTRIAETVRAEKIGVNTWSGAGCCRIPKKAAAKMRDAALSGCTAAIILHDLDRHPETKALNDAQALRRELEAIERPAELVRLVCIPVEELEAWFWSDDAVVKNVGRGKGKASPSPHLISSPKEALERLSRDNGGRPRYSTNKNKDLAEMLSLDVCAKSCPSFAELRNFVISVVGV